MIFKIYSDKYGIKEVQIDEDDWFLVSQYTWGLNYDKRGNKFYVTNNGKYVNRKRKSIRLHRLLTNCPNNFVVDHKNGDTLDNRKENLRVCVQGKNIMNSEKAKKKKTSPYKGVCFRKREQLYEAKININRERIYLGYHKTEEEAARAYNEAAVKYFGEFALLNILPEEMIGVADRVFEVSRKRVGEFWQSEVKTI